MALWRMSDTGEMYYNRVIGLNNMAYNLSTSAAQVRLLGSLLAVAATWLTSYVCCFSP